MSKIAKVKTFNIANGPGLRTAIFFSGCEFYCEECFNKDIWDFDLGDDFTEDYYNNYIKSTIDNHISGISILGGEPLHPRNRDAVLDLCEKFKKDFPNKTIYLWTGYTLENLKSQNNAVVSSILDKVDVLIDGPFDKNLKDLRLKLRGSNNQRILKKGIDF